MATIGVLALQGAVAEHIRAIEGAGAAGVAVKKVEQLKDIDGIILPGGESTTISKLMHLYGFMDALKQFHLEGKPIFGTCAGLILLAKEIEGEAHSHLGLMDIKVERNAFGRQRESFEAELSIPGVANDFVAVFIRAPYVKEVYGDVHILSKYQDRIVAVEQGTLLGTAFHPELTDDYRFHAYFVEKVKQAKHKRIISR
jgi:5'-phosphate synthase pdxT subunit